MTMVIMSDKTFLVCFSDGPPMTVVAEDLEEALETARASSTKEVVSATEQNLTSSAGFKRNNKLSDLEENVIIALVGLDKNVS